MPLLSSILQLFPSFQPGARLVDGGELQLLANQLFSSTTGIIAKSGGGQSLATPLTAMWNRVDTAGASDSVMLPQAIPGSEVVVYNNTANTLAVFGQPTNPVTGVGDTIAAAANNTQQATATGVTQATAKVAKYECYQAGQWKQMLSG